MGIPPKDPDRPIPPRLRGIARIERIRDLALGEQTQEQLAEKYGVSLDAIRQFSSYHKDEIRRAKQALVADPKDEYAGVAIARKWYRVADADQDLAHIEERLQDPNLTDTQRKGYLNLKSKLRREVAEERGELPQRVAVQVATAGKATYEIPGVDLGEVIRSWAREAGAEAAGLGASDAVPAGSSSVSEGHMSRDERVRSYVERKVGPVPESAPSVPASEVPEPSATSPVEVPAPRLKSWLNS